MCPLLRTTMENDAENTIGTLLTFLLIWSRSTQIQPSLTERFYTAKYAVLCTPFSRGNTQLCYRTKVNQLVNRLRHVYGLMGWNVYHLNVLCCDCLAFYNTLFA